VAKQPKEKGITKDRLVGMKVIDSNGNMIGTVTDIGFTVGKTGISLSMEDKEGETREIPWEDVQGAGDFVLLKPKTEVQPLQGGSQQQTAAVCPTCRGPLSYVQQYQRWYCYKCQKYV
jgi:sporulation protein YlmC with PRC-barrel domain